MRKHRKNAFFEIEDALEDPRSKFFTVANDILACVTLVSVGSIILETVPSLSAYGPVFQSIEYIATGLFTCEYFLRLHRAKRKTGYIFSFFGIIDLLAILPTYLGLGNFTFLKTARALRIVRLLRMIRLAKLAKLRKKDGMSSLYLLNIQIYAITLFTATLFLGALFYIFEGTEAYAQDIPSAMFWVFKTILGGISMPQPQTTGGAVIQILARFCSTLLLGLMLTLVATMMRKLLTGSEKDA